MWTNEIHVERRAKGAGKRTFQVKAQLAVQRPWGSRTCCFERATRRPVWLEQGAEVGECTAELCEMQEPQRCRQGGETTGGSQVPRMEAKGWSRQRQSKCILGRILQHR